MGEGLAYGTSICCVSRRLYVLAAASVLALLCVAEVVRWIWRSRWWDVLSESSWEVPHPADCTGSQCFEVFSCFGMKGATQHFREPLVTLLGVVVFPLGVLGAQHGYHRHLQLLGTYLTALALLHLALIVGDVAYLKTCDAYPMNVIQETMINWLPPSPVTNAAQAELAKMPEYPVAAVAKLTHDFPVLGWYLGVTGALFLFLAYTAREARLLSVLAERGPIGLGPCYGLSQWDQVLDHDAILRIKGHSTRSKFVEDCQGDLEESAPLARSWAAAPASQGPPSYGAAGASGFKPAPCYGAAVQGSAGTPLYLDPLDPLEDADEAELAAAAEAAAAAAAAEEEAEELEAAYAAENMAVWAPAPGGPSPRGFELRAP